MFLSFLSLLSKLGKQRSLANEISVSSLLRFSLVISASFVKQSGFDCSPSLFPLILVPCVWETSNMIDKHPFRIRDAKDDCCLSMIFLIIIIIINQFHSVSLASKTLRSHSRHRPLLPALLLLSTHHQKSKHYWFLTR